MNTNTFLVQLLLIFLLIIACKTSNKDDNSNKLNATTTSVTSLENEEGITKNTTTPNQPIINKSSNDTSKQTTDNKRLPNNKSYRKKTLREAYAGFFSVGTAINPQYDLNDPAKRQLIISNFSSITPKTALQPIFVQPRERIFKWDKADSVVNFAVANKLKVRGHCLIYYRHMPKWFFFEGGQLVSKTTLLQRMKDHITAEVSRYKGRVYAWDVVNEAMANGKNLFWPTDTLYRVIGADYVAKAFQFARDADPTAKLFYNEQFDEPSKRDKVYNFLKELKRAGVPIDGIGMQTHIGIEGISESFLDESINMFHNLGLEVEITELDVSIYRRKNRKLFIELNEDFTPEKESKQREIYKTVFNTFLKNNDKVSGITLWGYADTDDLSMIRAYGKKNYPLLFDRNLQPKKVLTDIINLPVAYKSSEK